MAITKEQAREAGLQGGNPLCDGREKGEFDDFIGTVLTVKAFKASKNAKNETIYAMLFEEADGLFFWAGGALQKYIAEFSEDFIGTKLKVGAKMPLKNNPSQTYRSFEVV